jgi:GxxExxY protein
MLARKDPLVRDFLGAAIQVHRALGPGLLESTYQACLNYELTIRRIPFRPQVPVPVMYGTVEVKCAYRVDYLIDERLPVELKSVEIILPVHYTQVLTYMKLLHVTQGLLVNFNVTRLMDGVKNLLLPAPWSPNETGELENDVLL